jgi:hypothetical protein
MSANEERGTTGQVCQISGVYYCVRHSENEIPLSKGERFPPCGLDGGHATTWILRRKA